MDDDLDTCANLADILSDIGYEVRTAPDAASALRSLEEHAFDIVLLDLKMPGMDGLQLYRELKRRSASTVAILITGFADTETCGAARRVAHPAQTSRCPGAVAPDLRSGKATVAADRG